MLSFEERETWNGLTAYYRCDNMFLSHRIDVRHLLRPMNELEIVFASAYDKSEALREQRGHLLCWNGHYGRVYVRKAQYHFGWDWGPSLVTCGPWKPVYLERYISRIQDIYVQVALSDDLSEATLTAETTVGPDISSHSVDVELTDPEGVLLCERRIQTTSTSFSLSNPKLWYPHTHGIQPLYQVKVTVRTASDDVLDCKTQLIGIRRIELIQKPLREGSSFYFKCNGVPMFVGGSNWIPGDVFLPRMTHARYKSWVDLAVRGNQNMLRVWGGGIYEDDAFYDECDRRGILVWQDFCFACGQYPSDDEFVQSVTKEAVQAIRRLRSHASLAIWAGNNEDYQIANEGLHHDMKMPEQDWARSTFGARLTYERILPDLVEKHAPGSLYWPGSPFGGVDNNSDRRVGDVHIWNVSSGMLLPYQRYPDITGRFVSEFGMLSCPSMATIRESFFGDSKDLHPQSSAFEFHCKASSYEKRMFTCMGENFRMSFELDTYVYLSQLVQSEAMYYAFRGWRRQFEGRECGGALVWQVGFVPFLSSGVSHAHNPLLQTADERFMAGRELGHCRLLRAAEDGLLRHRTGNEAGGNGYIPPRQSQSAAEFTARGLLQRQHQSRCRKRHCACHATYIPPQRINVLCMGCECHHRDTEVDGPCTVYQCTIRSAARRSNRTDN